MLYLFWAWLMMNLSFLNMDIWASSIVNICEIQPILNGKRFLWYRQFILGSFIPGTVSRADNYFPNSINGCRDAQSVTCGFRIPGRISSCSNWPDTRRIQIELSVPDSAEATCPRQQERFLFFQPSAHSLLFLGFRL